MAIILFCPAGIAAVMGWIPASIGPGGNNPGLATAAAKPAGAKTHTAPVQRRAMLLLEQNAQNAAWPNRRARSMRAATAAGPARWVEPFAGNQIERQVKSTKSHDISVRFDDGSSRTISATNAPVWHTGTA